MPYNGLCCSLQVIYNCIQVGTNWNRTVPNYVWFWVLVWAYTLSYRKHNLIIIFGSKLGIFQTHFLNLFTIILLFLLSAQLTLIHLEPWCCWNLVIDAEYVANLSDVTCLGSIQKPFIIKNSPHSHAPLAQSTLMIHIIQCDSEVWMLINTLEDFNHQMETLLNLPFSRLDY